MKKTIFVALASAFIFSCNSKPESTETTAKDSAAAEPVVENISYAYTPVHHQPDNWDMGDQKNVALVLASLKAFENGKVEDALAAFADSVQWSADGFDKKLSKEEIRKEFTDAWAKMASTKIDMDDYETVVSKDKKDNWVGLWYKQTTTYKSGKKDSLYFMDDLKIENGKITVLDEKQRKFPSPKK